MNKLRETPTEEERPARKPRTAKTKGARATGESRWARVAAFMRDERVHKVFGLFLILFSFYLLVAFTSYLFTWRMDQDLMSRPWGEIFSPDVRVENWLGKLGALISHQFIFRWFGVAAFLFVLWAFIGGVRISLKTWLLPFGKTLRWSLMGLFWLPTLLGFFFPKGGWQVLGGGIGYAINNHLGAWLGTFGAGALILFAATAFFVYTFNPSLSWIAALFQRKPKEQAVAEEAMPEEPTARINRLRPEIEEQPSAEEPFQEEEPQPETEEELAEEGELEVEQETEEEVPAPIALDATATAPDLSGITEEANGFSVEAAVKEEALTEAQIDAKIKEFGEYDPTLDLSSYVPPTLDLLEEHSTGEITVTKEELEENKNKIVSTLNNYNIGIDKIKATIGPTVTLYEIVPQAGVRISKIKNLEDDIALSLAALGIRIIAPIPGKGTIGIEVPNSKPQVVSMRAVVASEKFQNSGADLPIVLGKTISNETFVTDLAKMPHLLMAGATGQGKSVGLNAILVSLLYKKHPSQIKFVLVDPKKVELTLFNKIERHFLAKLPGEGEPIITDTKKVVATLNSLCIEMDERYELLKDAGVRNLKEYNAKFVGRRLNPENGHRFLPLHRAGGGRIRGPDHDRGPRGGNAHCPPGPVGTRHWHPPDHRHAAPQRQHHHRHHQGQLPGAHRLPRYQQGGQPHHPGCRRRRPADRPRRHAAEHRQRPDPHPMRLCGHARSGGHHRVHWQPARLSRCLDPARSAHRGRRRWRRPGPGRTRQHVRGSCPRGGANPAGKHLAHPAQAEARLQPRRPHRGPAGSRWHPRCLRGIKGAQGAGANRGCAG